MAKNNPVLFAKDLAGLTLYYPGQALLNRMPRAQIDRIARVGGGVVRRMGADEMRDELRRIFTTRPMPKSEDEILRETFWLTMYNELEVLRYPYLNPQTIGPHNREPRICSGP